MPETSPDEVPHRPRLFSRKNVLRGCGLVLVLAALYAVPRVATLRGISMVTNGEFEDMLFHLDKLNVMHLHRTLPPEFFQDPYFVRFPEKANPHDLVRWSRGVQYVALLWAGTFGPFSVWTTLLTNLVFTVVLVVGVFLLGRIMGGWRVGAWGAALVLLCPGLVAHSWYFSLDYPMGGMVMVGCYLLWRTRGFTGVRAALALAAWSALAMTVKVSYVIYLAGPCVAALLFGLRRPGSRLRVLACTSGAALLAGGLSLVINGWSPVQIWSELMAHSSGAVDPGFAFKLMAPWTIRWALAYVSFAVSNFPWPLLLLAIPGLVLAHRRRNPLPARWLLLTMLWTPYIVLTLMPHKMERYIQPLYPVLCLLAVWGITVLFSGRRQLVALVALVVSFAALLCFVHFHPTPWIIDQKGERDERWMHEIGMPGQLVLGGLRDNVYHSQCRLQPVLKAIGLLIKQAGGQRPVALAIDWPNSNEQLGPWDLHSSDLYMAASQLQRDRFLLYKNGPNNEPSGDQIIEAPTLIVMHPTGSPPGSPKVQASRSMILRCGPEEIPVTLSVFHPTGPPLHHE